MNDTDLKRRVHLRVLAEVPGAAEPTRAVLAPVVGEYLRDEDPLLPEARARRLVAELLDEIAGLGPLQPYLDDPAVSEIMVNGPGRVYVERAGRLERVDVPLDAAAITHLVERVVGPLGLRLDRASPLVDARLPDGARLHAVIPPLAIDGPSVCVRRFADRTPGLDAFDLDDGAAAYLRWAIAAGCNIVVAGATSAGKTTFCNALAGAIPVSARVVTIEETAELRLPLPHVVRLEARPPNAEGAGAVTVRDLVRAALRMRPDRIVVGEVRGPEAFDLLQACTTGHDGSLTTVHANGAPDVLHRLTSLVLTAGTGWSASAIRAQLRSAFDLVVHLERRAGGRRVGGIAEVGDGPGGVDPVFDRRGGRLVGVGRPVARPRIVEAGPPDPAWAG